MRWIGLLVCGVAGLVGPLKAEVSLSLPLDGYYRPGRYMPIRVRMTSSAMGQFRVWANGAVPTELPISPGTIDALIPLLPLTADARRLSWELQPGQVRSLELPLRPLKTDEYLVGLAGVDLAVLKQLPGLADRVAVRLDMSRPLLRTAAAWGALDMLVLDPLLIPELDPATVSTLLAGGTLLAVPADTRPDGQWAWEQRGSLWVLDPKLHGPRRAGVNAPALAPIQGWQAGWPAAVRRRLILYATLFACLMLAAALLPRRWAIVCGILLCILTTAVLGRWSHGHSSLLSRSGQVLVIHGQLMQADGWSYLASPRYTRAQFPWTDLTWPFFEDQADCPLLNLRLLCQTSGRPVGFSWEAMPGLRMGFLTRSVGPAVRPATRPAEGSNALIRLANRAYIQPGLSITGQLAEHRQLPDSIFEQRWPTLVIECSTPE